MSSARDNLPRYTNSLKGNISYMYKTTIRPTLIDRIKEAGDVTNIDCILRYFVKAEISCHLMIRMDFRNLWTFPN